MVQTCWEHLNRDYSMLTRIQAIFLDAHFLIEHAARNRSGRFFNFNGTAGIWRLEAILDAGGWQHDTLTEDLDLSYRAQLAGWRFLFLPDVKVPAENLVGELDRGWYVAMNQLSGERSQIDFVSNLRHTLDDLAGYVNNTTVSTSMKIQSAILAWPLDQRSAGRR